MSKLFSRKTPAIETRCIHLDLKGLPPSAERLLDIPEILSRLRVNCVLVEWEDVYPWSRHPQLRCETAYDEATVGEFLNRLAERGIEVIPLVQCLGHFETVLLRPEFAHLRELDRSAGELCPSNPESARIVIELIDDVLRTHGSRARRFHIGGDEPWTFGSCPRCKELIEQEGKDGLYLRHIDPILKHLEDRGIRPLLWDDKMRDWPIESLRRLAERAELMVWSYTEDIFGRKGGWLTSQHLDRYDQAGFDWWGAPAFKLTSAGELPEAKPRIENTLAWTKTVTAHGRRSVAVTGWSRGDVCRTAMCGLEPVWDLVVLAAAIMWDGKLPRGHVEAAREFVTQGPLRDLVGPRFTECREAVRELCEWNQAIAADPNWAIMEVAAWVSFEPQRMNPNNNDRFWKMGELRRHIERGIALGQRVIETQRGLVDDHWLRIFVDARVQHRINRFNALCRGAREPLDPVET